MTPIPPTPFRKALNAVALTLAVIALVAAAAALAFDKSLPYRIGPNYYTQYLWVFRFAEVSLAAAVAALVLGIVARRKLYVGLALMPVVFLVVCIGGVHSGPNPQAWCYNNLRRIEAAKWELAQKNNLTNGTVVTAEQLSPYIEGGFSSLKCAEHGVYTINPIGTEARCSVHGSLSEMEAAWKAEMDAQKLPPERNQQSVTNRP